MAGGSAEAAALDRRFRRLHAELSITPDLCTSSIFLLGITTLLCKGKLPYVGTKEDFPIQVAFHACLLVSHSLPIVVVATLGRAHYARWRWAYSVALLLDCIALLGFRCWEVMPGVESGDAPRVAFMVFQAGGSHLLILSLGRSLPFRCHVLLHTAMLLAGLVGQWRMCAIQLQCKYHRDFASAAEALRWVELPLFLSASLPLSGFVPAAALPPRSMAGSSSREDCTRACVTVHASVIAVLGYLAPLFIVYQREQQLRQRLAEELRAQEAAARAIGRRGRRRAPDPGLSGIEQASLFVLAMSFLCWVVRLLAEWGVGDRLGLSEGCCPGLGPCQESRG